MASFLGSLWNNISSSNTAGAHERSGENATICDKETQDPINSERASTDSTGSNTAEHSIDLTIEHASNDSVMKASRNMVVEPAGSPPQIHGSVEQTTPKAAAQVSSLSVPTFSLSEDAQDEQTKISARSTSTLAPPTRPATSLMPPPRVTSTLRPSNGPLPNRGPPTNSQQRVGSNSRGKVLLSPGHSPMDWAALTRSSNLSGVPGMLRVTPSQMKIMNGRKGKPIWSSYQGKVYNVTPYLPFHPGGEKELMKAAGRDGTKLFMEIHPWVAWDSMLSSCLVGILVSEGADEGLDAID